MAKIDLKLSTGLRQYVLENNIYRMQHFLLVARKSSAVLNRITQSIQCSSNDDAEKLELCCIIGSLFCNSLKI